MKTRHLILVALLSTVIILTGCEKQHPEYKIQIVDNHDLIPGQHWKLTVIELPYTYDYYKVYGYEDRYETISNTDILWEVESPEIVSIDSCGGVTAHKYGETRVTAYYAPYNSTYTTTIKVGEYLDFSPIYNPTPLESHDLFNQLIKQGVDSNLDNMISEDEIHAVEQLDLTDVTFPYIDVCTNLKRLEISTWGNFKMVNNTKLEYVEIINAGWMFLDRNDNYQETELNVKLDLSSCSELKYLELGECILENVDLSGCSKLEYLDYYGAVAKPYTFDCRNCPNLLYVNIDSFHKALSCGRYNQNSIIRLDPFFHYYYSQNPQRERTQAEKNELAYNGGLSELFPWSSGLTQENRNVLVNYEWYFNATLIQ